MLEAKNLEKFYREKQVVKKVSLQVKSNQIVGLLGSNGAGKKRLVRDWSNNPITI